MADLVQITFPSEEKAERVRQKLLDLQKEYLIELSDAVIAVKQPNGHVKLNELFHPTASGAVSGTFWGALIGMIFLMPLAGAAIGELRADHAFLLKGDVFNMDQIEAYMELKWEEVYAFEHTPHPIEFQMYYSV